MKLKIFFTLLLLSFKLFYGQNFIINVDIKHDSIDANSATVILTPVRHYPGHPLEIDVLNSTSGEKLKTVSFTPTIENPNYTLELGEGTYSFIGRVYNSTTDRNIIQIGLDYKRENFKLWFHEGFWNYYVGMSRFYVRGEEIKIGCANTNTGGYKFHVIDMNTNTAIPIEGGDWKFEVLERKHTSIDEQYETTILSTNSSELLGLHYYYIQDPNDETLSVSYDYISGRWYYKNRFYQNIQLSNNTIETYEKDRSRFGSDISGQKVLLTTRNSSVDNCSTKVKVDFSEVYDGVLYESTIANSYGLSPYTFTFTYTDPETNEPKKIIHTINKSADLISENDLIFDFPFPVKNYSIHLELKDACPLNPGFTASTEVTSENFGLEVTNIIRWTCTDNGAVSWESNCSTTGTYITYQIYPTKSPYTTEYFGKIEDNIDFTKPMIPSGGTSIMQYSSLAPGVYVVVGTQMGTETRKAYSQPFEIKKGVIQSEINISQTNISCLSSGKENEVTITPKIFSDGYVWIEYGNGPYQYQLLDYTTKAVVSSQNSPIFKDLAPGTYLFRIIDACGISTDKLFMVRRLQPIFSHTETLSYEFKNFWVVEFNASLMGVPPYHLTYHYNDGNGEVTKTITGDETTDFKIRFPMREDGRPYNVYFTLKDDCTEQRVIYETITVPGIYPPSLKVVSLPWPGNPCMEYYQNKIYAADTKLPFTVKFISYPAGFVPKIEDESIFFTEYTIKNSIGEFPEVIPNGDYVLELTTQDGAKFTNTYNLLGFKKIEKIINPKTSELLAGCNGTTFQVLVSLYDASNHNIPLSLNAIPKLVRAPAQYWANGGTEYPITQISPDKTKFIVDFDLLGDEYAFLLTTDCGQDLITSFETLPYNGSYLSASDTFDYSIVGCDSKQIKVFSLHTQRTRSVIIQKYYPESDTWGDDDNHILPEDSENFDLTAGTLLNLTGDTSQISNLWGPGKYRIVEVLLSYEINNFMINSCTLIRRDKTKHHFTFDTQFGGLYLQNPVGTQCSDGTYTVDLKASGSVNAKYTEMSGLGPDATPILYNINNPVFTNVTPGIHYYRIENDCGQFITRQIDTGNLLPLTIQSNIDCSVSPPNVSLIVPGFNSMTYDWYHVKDGVKTKLDSNTNILNLGSFNSDKGGIYEATVNELNVACVNKNLQFFINANPTVDAFPGNGKTVNLKFDPNRPVINLFDYIEGYYDSWGMWTEVMNTGMLNGNFWNSSTTKSGTYKFRYSISPFCNADVKFTEVTIHFLKECYKPPVKSGDGVLSLPTMAGHTTLERSNLRENSWLNDKKGGWLDIESNSKGLVLNRIAFDGSGLPIGIPKEHFIEGMMVFDISNQCLKIFNGTKWSCYQNQTCPD